MSSRSARLRHLGQVVAEDYAWFIVIYKYGNLRAAAERTKAATVHGGHSVVVLSQTDQLPGSPVFLSGGGQFSCPAILNPSKVSAEASSRSHPNTPRNDSSGPQNGGFHVKNNSLLNNTG